MPGTQWKHGTTAHSKGGTAAATAPLGSVRGSRAEAVVDWRVRQAGEGEQSPADTIAVRGRTSSFPSPLRGLRDSCLLPLPYTFPAKRRDAPLFHTDKIPTCQLEQRPSPSGTWVAVFLRSALLDLTVQTAPIVSTYGILKTLKNPGKARCFPVKAELPHTIKSQWKQNSSMESTEV